MSLKIKTSQGEVFFSDKFREYKNNQWSCRSIFKDDCFDYTFSFSSFVSKNYDTLWSEIVVVYDNALTVVGVPVADPVEYTQSSSPDALLKQVVKDVSKNLRAAQNSPEVHYGDTAFIYGQRHKRGYKVPTLEDCLFPRPQIPGEWELLGAIQKLD